MNLALLLEMAAGAMGERVALGAKSDGTTYAQLWERARRAATWLEARDIARAGLVDGNSEVVPLLLFATALVGRPFVPVNYRLTDAALGEVLARTAPSAVVVDPTVLSRVRDTSGVELVARPDFLSAVDDHPPGTGPAPGGDPDDVAVLLFTSGTTGEPKAAVLRHRHLTSYVLATVELMGAAEDEASLVSVPPYHVAGITGLLTSVYAGRRVVQLESFSAERWVAAARDEQVTQAMVVPTMLGRILDVVERDEESLPTLCLLSYGGGRMPLPVIERALRLLPHVDFVNAYGLTETASTVALLGPDDHRAAAASTDPSVRRRLTSVGRASPAVELEVRDGEVWVRGEQVAGEYVGLDAPADGWFSTRDRGFLDHDGYLFIEGRADDVIVRGGENLSPGEIEDTLIAHPAVADAGVVGLPDEEWGEKVVAAVVLTPGRHADTDELRKWVAERMRSTRTPEHVEVRAELPYNEMGKLLRRVLRAELLVALSQKETD